jgi:hypothetical protein
MGCCPNLLTFLANSFFHLFSFFWSRAGSRGALGATETGKTRKVATSSAPFGGVTTKLRALKYRFSHLVSKRTLWIFGKAKATFLRGPPARLPRSGDVRYVERGWIVPARDPRRPYAKRDVRVPNSTFTV